MVYYIRTYSDLLPEHFQEPRNADTVRRSIDGTLCVLAFDDGTEPEGWTDGMDAEAIRNTMMASESEGVWWAAELY